MHTPPGENEYISVNVSLFVIYIIYTYLLPPSHPRPLLRGPPETHFSIFIAFSFDSPTQFVTSVIRQYRLGLGRALNIKVKLLDMI